MLYFKSYKGAKKNEVPHTLPIVIKFGIGWF